MKSKFKMDAFLSWEVGIIIIVIGIFLIYLGHRQNKKPLDDINKIPWTKSTTKILFGGTCVLFGVIQLFPLLKEL